MQYLRGHEEIISIRYLEQAAKEALSSSCTRARCGTVIVKDETIIGKGYNSPPAGLESQRRCSLQKSAYDRKVTDKTCCVHAEQRAIMDALAKNPGLIRGSQLYFSRIDDKGKIRRAGQPYCTICSKMALDVGIEHFVLWHEKGIIAYQTEEYNDLSYSYNQDRIRY